MSKALKMKAGDRIRLLRQTINLTKKEFGALVDIEIYRLGNVESSRAKTGEDELAKICRKFPELTAWLVYEGDISLNAARDSKEPLVRLFCAQIDAKLRPDGFENKLVD